MEFIQPRASTAQQDDLELVRLAASAHRRGALGENDYPHIALLITACFGDTLSEAVDRAWSQFETAPPSVRGDRENDDTILAAMTEVAYQVFWLALTEAAGLGGSGGEGAGAHPPGQVRARRWMG